MSTIYHRETPPTKKKRYRIDYQFFSDSLWHTAGYRKHLWTAKRKAASEFHDAYAVRIVDLSKGPDNS